MALESHHRKAGRTATFHPVKPFAARRDHRPPSTQANGSNRPRVCENAQEPTSWRIVFSIALFPIAATALFLFRLAKSRKIFYAQIDCQCFRTGWPQTGH